MNIRRTAAVSVSAFGIFVLSALAPAQATTVESVAAPQPVAAKRVGMASPNDIGEIACRILGDYFEKC